MTATEVLQRTSATQPELQRVLDDVEEAPARAWLAEQDALVVEDGWPRARR